MKFEYENTALHFTTSKFYGKLFPGEMGKKILQLNLWYTMGHWQECFRTWPVTHSNVICDVIYFYYVIWSRGVGPKKEAGRCIDKMWQEVVKYLGGIIWSDGISSAILAKWCEVKGLSCALSSRRLRWFGHVKRRNRSEVLGGVSNIEVPG